LPIEQRVAELLGRMTVEEKMWQLDLYSGATALVDCHTVGQLPDFYNSDPSRAYKYVDDDGMSLFPLDLGSAIPPSTMTISSPSCLPPEIKKILL
jgi:hypothetical protein